MDNENKDISDKNKRTRKSINTNEEVIIHQNTGVQPDTKLISSSQELIPYIKMILIHTLNSPNTLRSSTFQSIYTSIYLYCTKKTKIYEIRGRRIYNTFKSVLNEYTTRLEYKSLIDLKTTLYNYYAAKEKILGMFSYLSKYYIRANSEMDLATMMDILIYRNFIEKIEDKLVDLIIYNSEGMHTNESHSNNTSNGSIESSNNNESTENNFSSSSKESITLIQIYKEIVVSNNEQSKYKNLVDKYILNIKSKINFNLNIKLLLQTIKNIFYEIDNTFNYSPVYINGSYKSSSSSSQENQISRIYRYEYGSAPFINERSSSSSSKSSGIFRIDTLAYNTKDCKIIKKEVLKQLLNRKKEIIHFILDDKHNGDNIIHRNIFHQNSSIKLKMFTYTIILIIPLFFNTFLDSYGVDLSNRIKDKCIYHIIHIIAYKLNEYYVMYNDVTVKKIILEEVRKVIENKNIKKLCKLNIDNNDNENITETNEDICCNNNSSERITDKNMNEDVIRIINYILTSSNDYNKYILEAIAIIIKVLPYSYTIKNKILLDHQQRLIFKKSNIEMERMLVYFINDYNNNDFITSMVLKDINDKKFYDVFYYYNSAINLNGCYNKNYTCMCITESNLTSNGNNGNNIIVNNNGIDLKDKNVNKFNTEITFLTKSLYPIKSTGYYFPVNILGNYNFDILQNKKIDTLNKNNDNKKIDNPFFIHPLLNKALTILSNNIIFKKYKRSSIAYHPLLSKLELEIDIQNNTLDNSNNDLINNSVLDNNSNNTTNEITDIQNNNTTNETSNIQNNILNNNISDNNKINIIVDSVVGSYILDINEKELKISDIEIPVLIYMVKKYLIDCKCDNKPHNPNCIVNEIKKDNFIFKISEKNNCILKINDNIQSGNYFIEELYKNEHIETKTIIPMINKHIISSYIIRMLKRNKIKKEDVYDIIINEYKDLIVEYNNNIIDGGNDIDSGKCNNNTIDNGKEYIKCNTNNTTSNITNTIDITTTIINTNN
ncbi:Cullin protein, partial [Spraguea lophii 42_110]